MFDWFDEFDFSKDTHKIILGVAGMLIGKYLYDQFFDGDKKNNTLNLPSSDQPYSLKRLSISPGKRGIVETLDQMAKMVRSDCASVYVRKKALEIVSTCAGHGFECEINALFHFCRDRITYRRDPAGVEFVQDARRTIESGHGDCDDKSVLLNSLAGALGHKSGFVVCGFKPDRFSHVYVAILTAKGYMPFDPTPENSRAGVHAQAPYKKFYPIFK